MLCSHHVLGRGVHACDTCAKSSESFTQDASTAPNVHNTQARQRPGLSNAARFHGACGPANQRHSDRIHLVQSRKRSVMPPPLRRHLGKFSKFAAVHSGCSARVPPQGSGCGHTRPTLKPAKQTGCRARPRCETQRSHRFENVSLVAGMNLCALPRRSRRHASGNALNSPSKVRVILRLNNSRGFRLEFVNVVERGSERYAFHEQLGVLN